MPGRTYKQEKQEKPAVLYRTIKGGVSRNRFSLSWEVLYLHYSTSLYSNCRIVMWTNLDTQGASLAKTSPFLSSHPPLEGELQSATCFCFKLCRIFLLQNQVAAIPGPERRQRVSIKEDMAN